MVAICYLEDNKIIKTNTYFDQMFKVQTLDTYFPDLIADDCTIDFNLESQRLRFINCVYDEYLNVEILSIENNAIITIKMPISAKEKNDIVFEMVDGIDGFGLIEMNIESVRNALISLQNDGVEDLYSYLIERPDLVNQIRGDFINRFNRGIVHSHEGNDSIDMKNHLMNNMMHNVDKDLKGFVEDLISILDLPDMITDHIESLSIRDNPLHFVQWVKIKNQDYRYLLSFYLDVTEIHKKQKEIDESEIRFRKLFEYLPVGIGMMKNRYLVQWNIKYSKIYGYEQEDDLYNMYVDEFIAPIDRERLANINVKRLEGKSLPPKYEFIALKKNGDEFIAEIFPLDFYIGDERYLLAIINDITPRINQQKERDKLQARLLSSHKLESLGVLSSGIAHDFNNILLVIQGGLDLLNLSENTYDKDILSMLSATTSRASNLIKQLLIYTGNLELKSEVFLVSEHINDLKSMIRLSVIKEIEINYHIDLDLAVCIEMDKIQFTQILMNFVINSSDAIVKNGRIDISLEEIDIDEAFLEIYMRDTHIFYQNDIQLGKYVKLLVRDTGTGIEHENISRIFDPFYSSKESGRGLGLSVVQGIIFYYNGFIEVISELNKGTAISVYLPVSKNKSTLNNISEEIDYEISLNGNVLICDDEEGVRRYSHQYCIKLVLKYHLLTMGLKHLKSCRIIILIL